ncbi:prolipoprotein diacylglyceryl transferase [Subtercola sp. PAMC28395]|uniref:prolipoprotein diacylglyceryl transferase n=1 Tax=Subtercola sp. PAMC28395 TaxID=2846775 RepID=UPI001C0DD7EF|nr:prolipoprotein diacylglyceryl transferase [Subtercola sp. PAMC28395]
MFVPQSIPSPTINSLNISGWLQSLGINLPFTIDIKFYAICILIGIVAATILTSRRLTKRGAEPGIVLDIILWAVPLGIIGARVFHVLTHPGDYFYDGANLWEVFAIWNGGIAIFGGLIGGAIGALIGCRLSGIRFWTFADALAPGLLLAQAFGRFGNYFNHELFGNPTDGWWGLEIPATFPWNGQPNPAIPVGLAPGTLFQPTFLYEVIWNLIGVAFLLFIGKKLALQWGKLFGIYLIWYGVGRSVWETIRVDPSEIFFGVRVNVWAAWLAILIGIVIIVVQTKRHPGRERTPYSSGIAWSPAGAEVDSGERYTDEELRGDGAVEAAAGESSADSDAGTTTENDLEPSATSATRTKPTA